MEVLSINRGQAVSDLELGANLRQPNFLGEVAVNNFNPNSRKPYQDIKAVLLGAQEKQPVAINNLKTNVLKDLTERLYKFNFISSPVYIDIDPKTGELYQNGQNYIEIAKNALIHATNHQDIMSYRAKIEYLNFLRIAELLKSGQLKDKSFLIMSLAEDNKELGFWTDTMTSSLQLITLEDLEQEDIVSQNRDIKQRLRLETAYVGGLNKDKQRHDINTFNKIHQWFKTNKSITCPADSLNEPLLIDKTSLPEGIISVVKLWDQASQSTNEQMFFGLNQPKTLDYGGVLIRSMKIENDFSDTVNTIIDDLIKYNFTGLTVADCIKVVNKICEKYAVKLACDDKDIDSKVFGRDSSSIIEHIRELKSSRQISAEIDQLTRLAIMQANSTSCPSGLALKNKNVGEDMYGSLAFTCPHCGMTNIRFYGYLIDNCQTCFRSVRCV